MSIENNNPSLEITLAKKDAVVVIYGTTASNKSMLALDIAQNLALQNINSVIINADSSQVYKEVLILNNSPTDFEKNLVPHKLFNFISLNDEFSVGTWLTLAVAEIKTALKNNEVPIVVGGTGLYISALLYGLSKLPSSLEAKNEAIELYNNIGHNSFLDKIKNIDPIFVQKFTDSQRLIRFYEVYLLTNKSILQLQAQNPPKKLLDANFCTIFIKKDRPVLINDIKNRFNKMIENNALDEVKNIDEKYFKKFLGAEELNLFLKNQVLLEQAVEKACITTNQYAKRQTTWFKNKINTNFFVSNYKEKTIDVRKVF
jgi:tRNA dimethylallyltransferase